MYPLSQELHFPDSIFQADGDSQRHVPADTLVSLLYIFVHLRPSDESQTISDLHSAIYTLVAKVIILEIKKK